MSGIGRSWLAYLKTDFQIILVDYTTEAVSPYRIVAPKLRLVHVPKFRATYTGVKFADIFDVL